MTNNISEAAQIKIVQLIAKELGVGPHQVAAAVALLDEGSTVPFIARYRKEATGNLDDTHLRNLDERLLYLRELEERRAVILASIEEQGKLTDELRGNIETAATKQALEDIYLPYKPKRRTRAQIAREAGLEPLADALFADPTLDPLQEAAKYVNVTPATESSSAINVPDAQAALDGARDILCERFAETAELLAKLRARLWEQGIVTSTVMKGKETAEEEKFRDYYAYSEAIRTIPSHRALALFRGREPGRAEDRTGFGRGNRSRRRAASMRRDDRRAFRHRRPRPSRRPVAGRGLPLDLARQSAFASQHRAAGAIARSGGSRGD